MHSAEGLRGRAAAVGPVGHSVGCKERQKSRVRFCGLRSQPPNAEVRIELSPSARTPRPRDVYSFVITAVDQSRHSVNVVLRAAPSFLSSASSCNTFRCLPIRFGLTKNVLGDTLWWTRRIRDTSIKWL